MMLLTTGYLKAVTKWQDGRSRWWCSLQIPNREVMQAYEDLEFKTVKTEEEMDEAARAALTQIESKEYTAELARQGVTEVWKYGIAFCGKKMWLEHR